MKKNQVKSGMLVVTVPNGFIGEKKVCQVTTFNQEDLDFGCVNVTEGDGCDVYARLSDCEPYDGDKPVGTVVGQVRAVDPTDLKHERHVALSVFTCRKKGKRG